ncbi:GntR family transcriptional regulator [Aminicella lysinilytica]|uniref:GntR family transcriptional regulator n=1 Tax=Aminicella lysinilytica TaxID=433323 RepID=UPI0026F36629|nr:GntR family transcriptional regulator [Aminicella lysinilytica]
MLNFDLQNHRPLREIVYEQLKRQILTGQITPGTRMMEVDLADEMGVSRTPVREAIRKLEKEGLVVIEPRRGAYASDISVKDMVDTLEVREDMEGLAAYLAAQKITPEETKELMDITQGYSNAINDGDMESIIHYDEAFHRRIVALSGNKTLIQLSETVQELALRFRYLYYDDFSRYVNMPDEHKNIIDALRSGDAQTARKVAGEHVDKLKNFVIDEGDTAFREHSNNTGAAGNAADAGSTGNTGNAGNAGNIL